MTGMTVRNFQPHSLNLLELQEYRVTNLLTAMHMGTVTLHCSVFVLTSTKTSAPCITQEILNNSCISQGLMSGS